MLLINHPEDIFVELAVTNTGGGEFGACEKSERETDHRVDVGSDASVNWSVASSTMSRVTGQRSHPSLVLIGVPVHLTPQESVRVRSYLCCY